jgi:hypothetical protein
VEREHDFLLRAGEAVLALEHAGVCA